jgi:type I restriction enzyme S subunit
MSFSTVTLSEILSPVNRGETPIAGKLYRQIGVRLWGEGAYEREPIDGVSTQYQRLFRTKANDVIVNKIWARNGSVAVVPENLDGCYGSNEFPIFVPVREKLEPRYFHWMTKTKDFWSKCDEKSRGTSGKNRIRPERFLEIEIPLPPLPEQRRIVARIEELVGKITKAGILRQQAVEETESLFRLAGVEEFSLMARHYDSKALGDVISMTSGEGLTSSQMDETAPYPVYGGGGPTGRYSRYLFEEPKIAIGRVGARCGCVFVTEPNSWITDNALYVSEISSDLDPAYLVHALTLLDLRQQANQAAQPVISQKKIKPLRIPIPPRSEQHRIVSYLDGLQVKAVALKKLQAETSAELDLLIASILDMAFKGELRLL